MDDTVSYINRFHTFHLSLSPSDPGSVLPFTLTPMLVGTTLLSSQTPLVYGAGCGVAGSGVPALNAVDHTHYFTGRSDGFDPGRLSTDPNDARFDTESIRVSNDRRHVYISDEYGPYVYEFDRLTGERTKAFTLPKKFAVPNLSAMGAVEISGNTVGRVANKGMEGLAITPDGRMLAGAMQSPLAQDGGDVKGGVTRIITIDIKTGETREYAYQLDRGTKTTISDISRSTITSSWSTSATARDALMPSALRLASRSSLSSISGSSMMSATFPDSPDRRPRQSPTSRSTRCPRPNSSMSCMP